MAPPAHARVPVIAAAGDIACDPRSHAFNGGLGRYQCGETGHLQPDPAWSYRAVFALGDLQYQNGRLWKFRRSYGPSWGRFKPKTLPVLGQPRVRDAERPWLLQLLQRTRSRVRAGRRAARGLVQPRSRPLARRRPQLELRQGRVRPRFAADQVAGRDLRRHRNRCVLAAYHHPRFSSGNARGRPGRTDDLAHPLPGRRRRCPQRPRPRLRAVRAAGRNGHLDRGHGIAEFVGGTGGHWRFGFPRHLKPTSRATNPRPWDPADAVGHGRFRWAYRSHPERQDA